MKNPTRRNIIRGQRKGIKIREGTREDLHIFYELYLSTSQRQRFVPYPEDYFSTMWELFNPQGYIQIFIADYGGEAVSTLLTISLGKYVIAKVVGWSGRYSECRPNQCLFWARITS